MSSKLITIFIFNALAVFFFYQNPSETVENQSYAVIETSCAESLCLRLSEYTAFLSSPIPVENNSSIEEEFIDILKKKWKCTEDDTLSSYNCFGFGVNTHVFYDLESATSFISSKEKIYKSMNTEYEIIQFN